MTSNNDHIKQIWQALPGRWTFQRKLQSNNSTDPSGKCSGTATFTPQDPAVFVDDEGQLQQAVAELLYHEKGEFEMDADYALIAPRFPFERKYIWRLSKSSASYSIGIWFVKVGSDEIDYLFHRILMQSDEVENGLRIIEFSGGHPCVDDYYSSDYCFHAKTSQSEDHAVIHRWTTTHEVNGPKKDQLIESIFDRL